MATKPPRPPLLAQIGDRVKNRPPRKKYDRLDDDDKMLILWGASRGWTVKKIAMALPAGQTTVKNYKARIFDDPGLVFDLPVLEEIGAKVYRCRLCGERRGSRDKVMRHVLAHILPEEIARGVNLGRVAKPL